MVNRVSPPKVPPPPSLGSPSFGFIHPTPSYGLALSRRMTGGTPSAAPCALFSSMHLWAVSWHALARMSWRLPPLVANAPGTGCGAHLEKPLDNEFTNTTNVRHSDRMMMLRGSGYWSLRLPHLSTPLTLGTYTRNCPLGTADHQCRHMGHQVYRVVPNRPLCNTCPPLPPRTADGQYLVI